VVEPKGGGKAVGAHEDLLRGKVVTYKHHVDLHHVDLHHIAHALEDLPEDARDQLDEIASTPENTPLRKRIVDEMENAALDAFGNLERAPLLHFLSHYPVTSYSYQISATLSRGERPSPPKLKDLFYRMRYQATINLCDEMAAGDDPIITEADLTGKLHTFHIPIVDMERPTTAQVIEFLGHLAEPGSPRTYVHCEAGKGRTGVMTACYRMAVMGWNTDDALAEAKNFGCSVPMQQAFIQKFGAGLDAQYRARVSDTPIPDAALGRYPLKAPGSVTATAQELAATVASAARVEEGDPQ